MPSSSCESELRRKIDQAASGLKPTRLTPENVSWGTGPDHGKLWIPENLAPLAGTPAYARLTDEQRLRYNQYYALQMAEQFAWLERYMIIGPLRGLLRGALPTPSMRAIIDSFITDEHGHTASLLKLARMARPDLYGSREFRFFMPPPLVRFYAALAARLPRLLCGWVLLVGVLEELTILISRTYKESNDGIDPLFATIYTLHAQDEARHCRQDSLIADWLLVDQGAMAKGINASTLRLAFTAYYDAGWGYDQPVRQVAADFSDVGAWETELLEEAKTSCSAAFNGRLTDRTMLPITSRNAERYDMLGDVIRYLSKIHNS